MATKMPQQSKHPKLAPDVIVDFDYVEGMLYVSVENIGSLPAYRISVEFDKKIKGIENEREISSLNLFKEIEDEVPPKVCERNLGAQTVAKCPHLVRPRLKVSILSDSPLESDCVILRQSGRFVARTWVGTTAILNDLRRSSQWRHPAQTGDRRRLSFKSDEELEVLVGI